MCSGSQNANRRLTLYTLTARASISAHTHDALEAVVVVDRFASHFFTLAPRRLSSTAFFPLALFATRDAENQ
jgi:hypothetical protein